MSAIVPDAVKWSDGFEHGAFYALNGCIDHIVPHVRGGDNSPENLVTACWPCNFGKMGDLIEELSLIDPRSREAVVDD